MSNQNALAIVLDCDDTLCDDSTTLLLNHEGLDPKDFWNQVNRMVREGWDPPLAYMNLLIVRNSERKTRHQLTNQHLREVGSEMTFYQGVPQFFDELRGFVDESEICQRAGVALEFYVISGGFEEMIRGSMIARYLNGIWACTFETDPASSEIIFPKTTVTFTEKTKLLFAINKGISFDEMKKNPYAVNDAIKLRNRRIPFNNIIYIGDGPSDIPCLSTVMKLHGKGVGVYGKGSALKGYQLARGERITVGPYKADYTVRSDLRNMLEKMIEEIALEVDRKMEQSVVHMPSYPSYQKSVPKK